MDRLTLLAWVKPPPGVATTQSQRRFSCRQPPLPQIWARPFSRTMAVLPLGAT